MFFYTLEFVFGYRFPVCIKHISLPVWKPFSVSNYAENTRAIGNFINDYRYLTRSYSTTALSVTFFYIIFYYTFFSCTYSLLMYASTQGKFTLLAQKIRSINIKMYRYRNVWIFQENFLIGRKLKGEKFFYYYYFF